MDERIQSILPPPVDPPTGVLDGLEEITAAMGTDLPRDYLDFMRIYGRGEIDGAIGIVTPAEIPQGLDYLRVLFAELVATTPGYSDIRLFPEEQGLIWWGAGPSRERWYWKVVGHPDTWGVVVEDPDARPVTWTQYQMTLTGYLSAMLSGELSDSISSEWASGPHDWEQLDF